MGQILRGECLGVGSTRSGAKNDHAAQRAGLYEGLVYIIKPAEISAAKRPGGPVVWVLDPFTRRIRHLASGLVSSGPRDGDYFREGPLCSQVCAGVGFSMLSATASGMKHTLGHSDASPGNDLHGGFDGLRLIAASCVLFSHSYALVGQDANEPLALLTEGAAKIRELAVYAFHAATLHRFLLFAQ
jgi:hypothetical protein